MKIVSSFMDEINIYPGEYHSITYESSYTHQTFRVLLYNYFANKRMPNYLENQYLRILDNNNGNLLERKDIYYINFDCNVIALKNEKNINKLIQNLLFYYLENNPDLLKKFIFFNEIGRAHVCTPVTWPSRMPSSA